MKHTTVFPNFDNILMDNASATMMAERQLGIFQPLEISPEAFAKAYELPIGEHVEKNYKGLSYLSWPFAVRFLKDQFPSFYVAFEEASVGWPVFGQEGCWLLRPYLTDGIKRTPALVFPLMDNKHNALKTLDARAVSDNIQRASVKCIATFTGLGLKLYAGEDIPKADDEQKTAQETARPSGKASVKKEGATAPAQPAGAGEIAPTNGASEFDGKAALLAICKANPLGLPDERASMMAGKAALQHLGLNKGEDIEDAAQFANVVTTMVSHWISKEGLTIGKEAMKEAIDKLRAICEEGTPEQAVKGIQAFVATKK